MAFCDAMEEGCAEVPEAGDVTYAGGLPGEEVRTEGGRVEGRRVYVCGRVGGVGRVMKGDTERGTWERRWDAAHG